MSGLGTMLEIGKKSLFANQTALQVTGNNISNANTEGYSRQAVRIEDGSYAATATGQLGTGVEAKQIFQYFDSFIEKQYTTKMSEQERWQSLYDNMQSVEKLFNESTSSGVNSIMSQFWSDWSTLSTNPDDPNTRAELLSHASGLIQTLSSLSGDLSGLQEQTDAVITSQVSEVNTLLGQIVELNQHITAAETSGTNQAVGLRDERTKLVRSLAEKMDISVIDNGQGNMTITTTAGQTLVDGSTAYSIGFEKDQVQYDLRSDFQGTLNYEGSSSHEYLVRMVSSGALGTAQFKVSVDGGVTWLQDENGQDTFTTNTAGGSLLLPDGKLRISFAQDTGSGDLEAGDSFTILPKKTLFWYNTAGETETSSGKVNITPQILTNGQDDNRRLVGGSLSGLIQYRDNSVGAYMEKLDAFSKSLAWEVNRLHSQGAGTTAFTDVVASSKVLDSTVALGQSQAGLFFGDKLSAGNINIYVYDQSTGNVLQSQTLDFSGSNFDPAVNSLDDVVTAVNNSFGGVLTATIEDGHLQITAADGKSFAFGSDSTGLLAALGINTFFDGTDADSLSINANVRNNIAHINSGRVNGAGEMNSGDNATAAAIASLQNTAVATRTVSEGTTRQTLDEYYATLASKAGADTQSAKFNAEYQKALADDLKARQEEVAGVNLDEEMTNLIKFQHAYTAAAKLITTAESMMQVLLGIKQ